MIWPALMASRTRGGNIPTALDSNLAKMASLCNRVQWTLILEDKLSLPLNKKKILEDGHDLAKMYEDPCEGES